MHRHEWHLVVRVWTPDERHQPWDDINLIPEAECWNDDEGECDAVLTYQEIESILNQKEGENG